MIGKLDNNNKLLFDEVMYVDIQNILELENEKYLEYISAYFDECIPKNVVKNLLNNCIGSIALSIISRIEKKNGKK